MTDSTKAGLRVLVCGGRDYATKDRRQMLDVAFRLGALSDERGPLTIIEGGASGADAAAYFWATIWGVDVETFPADWAQDGRAAGPMRNARMLREARPDLVLAFPGGRGTADMVRRARAAGVPVEVGGEHVG
ncbi:hypothetical protein DK419_13510 [Methylobacterium terrae]|uniref:YspA cpYpsA-related SLOG domain-containing protein n=1 Tax=Methylobacterium terrae TaxID=2202827 RepID=A0A2U8WP19_9HYPH|nr:SLOG family protein [Methylobacterium terrae]AWN47210.1 hypothetical protein DK419_13510 [Methylobacterium terrae]